MARRVGAARPGIAARVGAGRGGRERERSILWPARADARAQPARPIAEVGAAGSDRGTGADCSGVIQRSWNPFREYLRNRRLHRRSGAHRLSRLWARADRAGADPNAWVRAGGMAQRRAASSVEMSAAPPVGDDRLEHGVPWYLPLDPHPALVFVHLPRMAPYRATGVVICPPFGWEEVCSYRARRTWAQTLARAGFPTVRLDLPGTGDSAGSPRSAGLLELWTGALHSTAAWLRTVSGCERVAAIGIGL